MEEINTDEAVFIKEKANFGLTGALARDAETGNLKNGVLLKWSAPLDEATPDQHWRLYVFKEGEIVETLHIHRQASYLIGRDDRVADILLAHPSISKQHAVIQFREVKQHKTKQMVVKPYIMDLGSTHKTKLNGNILEDARYYELREKDQLKFGASTREYIIMCAEQ